MNDRDRERGTVAAPGADTGTDTDTVPLRVLVVHNLYQQAGGEDAVFANEVALLRSSGCIVETLTVSNDWISGPPARARAALGVVHSRAGARLVEAAVARTRPDIVHVHNFFPTISPAVFDACAAAAVPTVWTLHNFRVACANGLLFRDGHPCEECVGRLPLPAVRHACYRGSTLGSAAVAAMIGYHRLRGTWHDKVTRYIALTEFARSLVVRAGLPAERVAVKGNFLADPRPALRTIGGARAGAVFVGRVSPEKGVATLIAAWRALPGLPLTIIGDGPDRAALERAAPPHVRFLGFQPRDVVLDAVGSAQMLVVPSLWYEGFPMAAVEAMALGTPVIASRIGVLESIVTDGCDGLHFKTGNAADLTRIAMRAATEPSLAARLGAGARRTWAARMSPQSNLETLLSIYRDAIAQRHDGQPRHAA